jgi:5'-3' exonuclease
LHTNEEFIKAFKKHVIADIAKLRKKWKVDQSHHTNIIFCSDCPRSNIWRNEIYSAYKGTRVQAKTFNPNIFEIFYKMIVDMKYYELESSNLEADDIVYTTTKYLVDNNFENDIVIITNDNDYLQILALRDRIFIHNMLANNSDISSRSKGTPSLDLLLKVLMGDTSDNIPSIWEKVGPKTALKLANMSEVERNKFILSKGSECQKNYDRNLQLVSFSSIPLGLAQKYLDKYKFIVI